MNEKNKNIINGLNSDENYTVDTDQLWSSIEPRLPQKQSRKIFWIWMVGLAFISSMISFILLHYYHEKENETPSLQVFESTENSEENITVLNDFEVLKLSIQDSDIPTSKVPVSPKNSDFAEEDIAKKDAHFPTRTGAAHKEEAKSDSAISGNSNNISLSENPLKNKVSYELNRLEKIHSSNFFVRSDSHYPGLFRNDDLIQPIRVPRRRFISMTSGLNFAFSNVNNAENGTVSDFQNFESALPGIKAQFSYGIEIFRNWTLRLGMGYENSIIRYQNQTITNHTRIEPGISYVNISESGLSSEVQGEVEVNSVIRHDIQWHRKHQMINLHLFLQKSIFRFNRWEARAELGAAYNLFAISNGYVPDIAEGINIIKFSGKTNPHYKHNVGFIPSGGVELEYKMKTFSILLNGNFSRIIKPINTNQTQFQIKHSQTGVQLGMRYNLNGN